MDIVAAVVICYLIGAVPFSYIFARLLTKEDIRTKGSGNVGATNAFRTSGWIIGALSLTGDLCKGILAAWLGQKFGPVVLVLCGWAVVLGHCYPVFLGFKGGKGVASAAGVLFFLMPDLIPALVIFFAGVVFLSRYVSMGSIASAYFVPFLIFYSGHPWNYMFLGLVLAAFVIYRHKENILRLRSGQENKITDKVQ